MTDQTTVQCWPGEQSPISATTTVTDSVQLRVGGVVLTLTEQQTTRLMDTLRGPLAEIRRRQLRKSGGDHVAEIIRALEAVKSPLPSAAQLDWEDQHRGHRGQPMPEWVEGALPEPKGRRRRG